MSTIFCSCYGALTEQGSYSTSEKSCGKWIDGKTIYRKSYSVTTPTVATNGTMVNKDIESLSFSTIIKIEGMVVNGGNTKYQYILPLISQSNYRCNVTVQNGVIGVQSSWIDLNNGKVNFTVYYTKP